VETALETKDFNSSLGARVYLFQTGWDGFVESPWVGVGAAERTRRLQSAGLQLPPAETEHFSHVRTLGHVHNQYLHQAMDGGLLGLSGLLAILAGMIAAAWRLRRAHKIASQQLAGIAFVHATASLSNVNFAHNYYVLMLGLSISVVFLQAATKTKTDKSLT
jgi:O-antigen ligase